MNEESHINAALEWLFATSDNPLELAERIECARQYYRLHTECLNGRWSTRDPFDGYGDRMAVILTQAVASLRDRRTYDVELASQTLPFIVAIGSQIDELRRIQGADDRARRMLRPSEDHPESGIFELVAALRYTQEPGLHVAFIPESSKRTADFRVFADGDDGQGIHVECKRLKPSSYEANETRLAYNILNRVNDYVHEQKISLVVDVTFSAELAKIPEDYILNKVRIVCESPILLSGSYPWRDEFGEGVVRPSDLISVHRDIRDSSLLLGSKLARLLAGGERLEEQFHLVCGGTPRLEDTRFIDEIEYGSAIFWRCLAEQSIEARARHIRSKLADIDRQVSSAPFAIAHIGMDVERDPVTADRRRERNMSTAATFRSQSQLIELDLHYFMPRVSEVVNWMIDETVEPYSRMSFGPFLSGAGRLLAGTADGLIEHQPAWRQKVPL